MFYVHIFGYGMKLVKHTLNKATFSVLKSAFDVVVE